MMEYRPELTEDEEAARRLLYRSLGAEPVAHDKNGAIFDGLTKKQFKEVESRLRRLDRLGLAKVGDKRTIGGRDYLLTQDGWAPQ